MQYYANDIAEAQSIYVPGGFPVRCYARTKSYPPSSEATRIFGYADNWVYGIRWPHMLRPYIENYRPECLPSVLVTGVAVGEVALNAVLFQQST